MHSVVLVDDQVLFAESLRNVIESRASDFSVAAVFYDGDEAVRAIGTIAPDLVLMDVRMPGTDGVQATRQILQEHPDMRVVMLTTYDEDEYLEQAIHHGAVGYLLKDMPPDALLTCMRSAIHGQFQIPTKLAGRILDNASGGVGRLHHRAPRESASRPGGDRVSGGADDPPDWLFELSRKERMILRLIVEGYENDEIAERVFLASQTVKNYISKLYAKTDVDSRAHLIRTARTLIQYL